MRGLERFGVSCAALAYLFWNIDQHFCPLLTTLERRIGLPFDMLLELHGQWHILTATSAYIFIALVEYLTSKDGAPEDRTEGGFVWPVRAVLRDIKGKVQEVVRTREDEYAIPQHLESLREEVSKQRASNSANLSGYFLSISLGPISTC